MEYKIYVWNYSVEYGRYWITLIDTSKESAACRIVENRNPINQEDIVRYKKYIKQHEDAIILLEKSKDGFKYSYEIEKIDYEIRQRQQRIKSLQSKLDYLLYFKEHVIQELEECPLTDIIETGWEE